MKKLFTLIALLGMCVSGAWADTRNFTIDLSKFDNGLTYDSENKVASITIGSKSQWSKLDLKEYIDQIDGNITNIKITLTENIGTDGRMALGLYDYNKSSWATNAYQDAGNSVTVWGLLGRNSDTRFYYNSSSTYTAGVTLNTDAIIEVDMNFSTKKFTLKQDGTTKVNGQNFVDTNIDLIRWFALYSWSANTTTIKNMSMEVTYSAVKHIVTFSETNSRSYSVVVKDAVGNTVAAEDNGSYELSEGKTYYYTATPSDIMEYRVITGSFTVGKENINIPLTFTTITLPEYTLPAKALYSKATVPSGTRQTTGIARTAANTTGVGGPMNNSWTWTIGNGFTWHATFDVYRADESASVNMKMYGTNGRDESTSFQFDNGGVKYWTSSTTSYISNTALTPGKWYRVEIVSDLVDKLTVGGNTMTVTVTDIDAKTQFATKSGIGFRNTAAQWFLPTNDKVTNTILTNWYSYYIADEYTKTLGETGFATFSATCPVTVPTGVTVYESTCDGETLTATPCVATVIPANTGVIVKGTKGTEYTFTATETAGSAITTALTAAPNGITSEGNICALLKDEMTFAKVMSGVTLGANTAYLPISAGAKNIRVVVGGATGIENVASAKATNKAVKRIMNGQLVIEKAGKMYNAAGQVTK